MIKDEESVVRFVEFTPNLSWTEGLQALLQYLQKGNIPTVKFM